VTFLGTKFENLRVGGARVDVVFNPRIFTVNAPAGDKSYLEDPGFLKEMGSSASFPGLNKQWQAYVKQTPKGSPKPGSSVKGTLAEKVSYVDKTPFPSSISDNVITVPDFGKIILAELDVDCDTFHLTMIRLEMGCLAAGTMTMSAVKRDRGVSDYGTLVQGHAGVLDRIDSICFAAPVFFHITRYFFSNL